MNVDIVKELLEINQLLNLWNTYQTWGPFEARDRDGDETDDEYHFNEILADTISYKIELLVEAHKDHLRKTLPHYAYYEKEREEILSRANECKSS
jgi:hypothetical protein